MIRRFLTAQHWHLFMLIFVLPLLLHFTFMVITIGSALSSNDPREMFTVFYFFPIIFLVVFFGTYGWQWSVAVGLHSKLPTGVRMNLKRFKAFFLVPIIYLILAMAFFMWMFTTMSENMYDPNPLRIMNNIIPMMMGTILLFPIALFSLFCQGYCIYFCAKTLRTIELGRETEVGDYIGEFFLFLFNFIGVWIMQPRINNIALNFPDHPQYETFESGTNQPLDPDTPRQIPQDYNREKLRGKDHEAFRYDDEFDGII